VRAALVAFALAAATQPAPAAADQAVEDAVELAAPAELVWGVLTDFASWPRFVSGLKGITIEGRGEGQVALRHETEKMGFAIGFTALARLDASLRRLDLALDENAAHDVAAMRATWQVTPLEPGRVRVEFRSSLDSGRPVPGFVERRVLRESVSETLKGLGAEVERLQALRAAVEVEAPGQLASR
jgi:ribosome-associated toxin RatA of RatAB toxin-antitoxin module